MRLKHPFAVAAAALALACAQPAAASYAPIATPTTSNPTSTITRPANATPYLFGQLYANSTTAGSVVLPTFTATSTTGCSFDLGAGILSFSNGTGLDQSQWLVHLFTTAPTYVGGDGATWQLSSNDDKLVATLTCTVVAGSTKSSGLCSTLGGFPASVKLAGGVSTVAWDLETQSAFTPASGTVATFLPMLKQDSC